MGCLNSSLILFILCLFNISTIINSQPSNQETKLFGGNFPALYVIGDSLVDSGNNNNLQTVIKSNFPPYGSDFEGHKATGRFCNGKTIADFVAIYYELPLVPAYMGLSEEEKNTISTGFNYASASCGVFPETGKRMGKCLSMNAQVDLFNETIEMNLKKKFPEPLELEKHLAESLFMTAIGINDYFFSFNQADPNEFSSKLLNEYLIQIERLHKLGARKFFINNLKPLGCYPNVIATNEPRGSCKEGLNKVVGMFNDKLSKSLGDLKQRLNNTSFLYSDYFNFMLGLIREPPSNGSSPLNTTSPCCPEVYDGGRNTSCTRNSVACKEPNTYIFFDPFHPTQVANFHYSVACLHKRTICHVV